MQAGKAFGVLIMAFSSSLFVEVISFITVYLAVELGFHMIKLWSKTIVIIRGDRCNRWKHSIAVIVVIADVEFHINRSQDTHDRCDPWIVGIALLWCSYYETATIAAPLNRCDCWRSFTITRCNTIAEIDFNSWQLRSLAVTGIFGDHWQNENLVFIWSLPVQQLTSEASDREQSPTSFGKQALIFSVQNISQLLAQRTSSLVSR